jgi:hypothetical protein
LAVLGSRGAVRARLLLLAAAASLLLAAGAGRASLPGGFFDAAVTDAGCAGCVVSVDGVGVLSASVAGGADGADTAYGVKDVGGPAGVSGRLYVRTVLGLAAGEVPGANLAVLQVRDVSDALVYELYVAPNRTLRLWSPAGGLQGPSVNRSTGAVVPNDGASGLVVEVSALANAETIVRVDGVDRIALPASSGATTGRQRYLRAGIDHYDGTAADPIAVVHGAVSFGLGGWLGQPPRSTAPPEVAGLAQQGETLQATGGEWANDPTSLTLLWLRCDAAGAGCGYVDGTFGQSSYPVTAADVGSTLRVEVRAENGAGLTAARSAPTSVVGPGSSGAFFDSLATDEGCAGCRVSADGATLTATVQGGADAVDTAYGQRAFRGPGGLGARVYVRSLIGLAAGQTLAGNLAVLQVLTADGARVWELFLASNRTLRLYSPAGGLQRLALNRSTGIVVPNDGTSIRVEVSALANESVVVRVNGVTKIDLTGLTGASTRNQAYLRAGIDHYDTTSTNGPVTVTHGAVAFSLAGWLGVPGGEPPVSAEPPAVTGAARQDETLQAAPGTWSNEPTAFAYQWQRCDEAGGGCVDIVGETGETYTLRLYDVLSTIRVQVNAANAAGSAFAYSERTAVVAGYPPVNTGPPTISGLARLGERLSGDRGAWADDPSSPDVPDFAYQWLRCDAAGGGCADIPGAETVVYTLVGDDVGSTITLRVTATNSAGPTEADSDPTAVVTGTETPAPASTSPPVVFGPARQAQTHVIANGSWANAPTSFAYQWQLCDEAGDGCTDIPGATAATYNPGPADVGGTLRVRERATNAGGSADATSPPSGVVLADAFFDTAVTEPGCGFQCTVHGDGAGTLTATIDGGLDDVDTAYGLKDFGGPAGLAGRVYVRSAIGLADGQALQANLAVLQVRDASDRLVWELYLSPQRVLRLYSPPRGLRGTKIDQSTGVTVPNDGSTRVLVEVSALADSSIVVRVNGAERVGVTGLAGATSGNQRYLRAGVDHYDAGSAGLENVSVTHAAVAVSQTGWPGPPAT